MSWEKMQHDARVWLGERVLTWTLSSETRTQEGKGVRHSCRQLKLCSMLGVDGAGFSNICTQWKHDVNITEVLSSLYGPRIANFFSYARYPKCLTLHIFECMICTFRLPSMTCFASKATLYYFEKFLRKRSAKNETVLQSKHCSKNFFIVCKEQYNRQFAVYLSIAPANFYISRCVTHSRVSIWQIMYSNPTAWFK